MITLKDAMEGSGPREWFRWIRHPREAADVIFGRMFGPFYRWWARRNPVPEDNSPAGREGGGMTSEASNHPVQDNECDHEWEERVDSMFSNEYNADVRCKKCDMPGEQDRKTGKVFFPAT